MLDYFALPDTNKEGENPYLNFTLWHNISFFVLQNFIGLPCYSALLKTHALFAAHYYLFNISAS